MKSAEEWQSAFNDAAIVKYDGSGTPLKIYSRPVDVLSFIRAIQSDARAAGIREAAKMAIESPVCGLAEEKDCNCVEGYCRQILALIDKEPS